jgi:hypothetical protein
VCLTRVALFQLYLKASCPPQTCLLQGGPQRGLARLNKLFPWMKTICSREACSGAGASCVLCMLRRRRAGPPPRQQSLPQRPQKHACRMHHPLRIIALQHQPAQQPPPSLTYIPRTRSTTSSEPACPPHIHAARTCVRVAHICACQASAAWLALCVCPTEL